MLASEMRQVKAVEGGEIAVSEVEVPHFGSDEALVRSSLVGICGSDTHALAGGHPFLYPPYVPGHEAVGVVEAVGAGVVGLEPGTRVLLKPNLACGECVNCVAGRTNCCQKLAWIGCDPSGTFPGAMADYFVAPARNLFPLPDSVSDEEGVLVECLATPVHAVAMAGNLEGQRVVVIGAGTIGLLAVIAARHSGAKNIVSVDFEAWKLERAMGQGASQGVLASSANVVASVLDALGGRADVVFDAVAHQSTVEQALSMLRRAGSLFIVGVPPRPYEVNMPVVQDWEIRLQGSAAYTELDIRTALDIAAAGGIPAREIVTETFPIDDAGQAFASASANASGKVMVSCNG